MSPPTLVLAPLRGFTNFLYRNIYSHHFQGIDTAIAPFINTLSVKEITSAHIRDILPENNSGMAVIPQIIGNNPAGFIQLSAKFHDLGFDTVNWNLGCPAPMVANKHRGSGLLPYPDRIRDFLDHVLPRIRIRLSIKTRIGRESRDEIFRLLPVFNQYPVEELIIHPRTGRQMYTGTVDLDTFEACLALSDIPITYNGDIFDPDSFVRLTDRFPTIPRWLVGRGVLANPFLPEMLRSGEETISRPVERFKKFHNDLFDAYRTVLSGPAHLVGRMKGYWLYFHNSFENGEKFFKKIKKVDSIPKYEWMVKKFLEEDAIWHPKTVRCMEEH